MHNLSETNVLYQKLNLVFFALRQHILENYTYISFNDKRYYIFNMDYSIEYIIIEDEIASLGNCEIINVWCDDEYFSIFKDWSQTHFSHRYNTILKENEAFLTMEEDEFLLISTQFIRMLKLEKLL